MTHGGLEGRDEAVPARRIERTLEVDDIHVIDAQAPQALVKIPFRPQPGRQDQLVTVRAELSRQHATHGGLAGPVWRPETRSELEVTHAALERPAEHVAHFVKRPIRPEPGPQTQCDRRQIGHGIVRAGHA